MKINKKILIALMLAGLSTATMAEEKDIKIMVKDVDGVITKTVIVNGKELNDEEIVEMEASGDLEVLHLDSSHGKKVMFIKSGDSDGNLHENIEILLNADGDNVTKKVIMNGKELTEEEISKLELEGKLKTLHIDKSGPGSMHKVMFIGADEDASTDGQHEIEIHTQFVHADVDHATLGVMTSIKDDGWHIISTIDGSGAQEAGLKAGDIIKFMGEVDLSKDNEELQVTLEKIKYAEGEMVDLEIQRGEELLYLSVEARKNKSIDMTVTADASAYSWTSDLQGLDFDSMVQDGKNVKVIVMDGKDLGKSFNMDNMDLNLPEMIGNMNFFITDGSSTSKLLGKNHKMSALNEGLASYFGTKQGVLMMQVGKDNIFGLEDGDVIKSIAGISVKTPKDVIKQLMKADNQEDIKLKIVRHKRNKTLKYNK